MKILFKVVFIDDETLVKVGLRSMLDWEKEEFEIEGEASNGCEGLELILNTQPDLVITDITMPEMDGIEMMQRVKESEQDPIFIVLSSYDQFELVKRAMQLGARDYLLKLRLNREMLRDMLKTVREELEKREGKTDRKRERSVWETQELRKAFLKKAVLGSLVQTEGDGIDPEWEDSPVRIIYIVTNAQHVIGAKEEADKKIYLDTIRNLIEDICREFFQSCCIEWGNGRFLIVCSDQNRENAKDDSNMMAEAIIDVLMQYSNIRASIGISGSVVGYADYKKAYLQAKQVQDHLAVEGYGSVRFFEDTPKGECFSQKDVSGDSFSAEKLASICETLHLEGLEQVAGRVVEDIKENGVKLDNAASQCARFMCLLEEYLKQNWSNRYRNININDSLKRLYHSDTIAEIVEVFDQYTEDVKKFFASQSDNEQERIVREAKKYIREHVYENISLKEISQALFISAGYLSTTFSKYEPIGVANYINKVKIEEARRLLMKQRLKVYEVAFQLKYENAGYFAKVFKKYTGCTPKEYMEQK